MRGAAVALALLATACSSTGQSSTTTVRVLAASSLTDVYEELAGEFELANPDVRVELQFAGSSQLASLIEEGAPGDLFAAADLATMQRVVDSGETRSGPRIFATNTLTLVVPPDNEANVIRLVDLADRDLLVAHCALGVPCGSATAQLFASVDLFVEADSFEPNVRSVLTKVELGEVDVGIVYVTDARAAADRVTEIPIDADWVVNEYSIVPLGKAHEAADRFVAFVLSSAGQTTLADYGFGPP